MKKGFISILSAFKSFKQFIFYKIKSIFFSQFQVFIRFSDLELKISIIEWLREQIRNKISLSIEFSEAFNAEFILCDSKQRVEVLFVIINLIFIVCINYEGNHWITSQFELSYFATNFQYMIILSIYHKWFSGLTLISNFSTIFFID